MNIRGYKKLFLYLLNLKLIELIEMASAEDELNMIELFEAYPEEFLEAYGILIAV